MLFPILFINFYLVSLMKILVKLFILFTGKNMKRLLFLFFIFAFIATSIETKQADAFIGDLFDDNPKRQSSIQLVSADEFVERTPLMIIRFNRRNISYEEQLYNVLSRALEVKPSVRFEIVSMAPIPSVKVQSDRLINRAYNNGKQIAFSMQEMGIPANRIDFKVAQKNDIRTNEVLLFVR